MRRPARESVAVLAMVAVLLLASVASLTLPVLRLEEHDEPVRERPGVSERVFTPSPDGPTGTEPSGAAAAGTTGRRPTALVDCDPVRVPSGAPDSAADPPTGENVSVAVIDPSGFAVNDPDLAGRIAGARSFDRRDELGVRNGGANRHGTAVAEQVAGMAPDARLYLANFRDSRDFTRAVEWAVRRDVDVIVAPTVFYAKPNDGTAPVSRAVARAAEEGVPVVVPTGNVANRHWEGTYRGGRTGGVVPDESRLYIDGGGDRIEAWLWWNRSETGSRDEFTLALYRETDDGPRRIAESSDHPGGPVGTNQVLAGDVRSDGLLSRLLAGGPHFLRIEGAPNGTHRVELVVTTHRLSDPVPRGSITAPATARHGGVVSVGAGRRATDEPLPRSGRGPTNDGRRGVDVLAPATITGDYSLTGTSAATAYAGGVVTLIEARNPSLSPAEVRGVLAETADGSEVSDATGYGMIDRGAALECARSV